MDYVDEPVDLSEVSLLSDSDVRARINMIDSEVKILKNELTRLKSQQKMMQERIKDNTEKIQLNKQLPYLVATVVEVLDSDETDDDFGAPQSSEPKEPGKSLVIKTSTRQVGRQHAQTIYLPVIGLIPHTELKPGELVGVNKDSYLVLDKLPPEYDNRVKAMEVCEKPTEDYSDIGGLDKQIQELIEAIGRPA